MLTTITGQFDLLRPRTTLFGQKRSQDINILSKGVRSEIKALRKELVLITQKKAHADMFWNKITFTYDVVTEGKSFVYRQRMSLSENHRYIFKPSFVKEHWPENEQELQDLDLFDGKYIKLTVDRTTDQAKGRWGMEAIFEFSLPTKQLSFLRAFSGDSEPHKLVLQIMKELWVSGKLPAWIDPTYTPKKPKGKLTGPVKLSDGSIIYIPDTIVDRRKEFFEKAASTGNFPPSFTILMDLESDFVAYTNSNRELQILDLRGYVKLSSEDLNSLFELSISQALADPGSPGSVARIIRFDVENDINTLINSNWSKPLWQAYDEGILQPILKAIKEYYIDARDRFIAPRYLAVMGIIQAINLNIGKHQQIRREVEERRENFDSAKASNMPAIPSLRKDMVFFPHQAESLAKLDQAGETAIIDISTGGGKTATIMADILNLMKKGKIKRPLVVVPNQLVGQWMSEIIYFTDGKINPIAVTTETVNNWSEKDIVKLADTAPPNSIFITTYSFLTNDSEEGLVGKYFPKIDWIKSIVRPDYVACDESHLIKNEGAQRSQAIISLRDVPYRRIATGTLIVNTPIDMVNQVAFLNPRALGTKEEFVSRYALRFDKKTFKVSSWQRDAAEKIRRDLRKNTFYLIYREPDWAAALPDISYGYHIVDMTKTQEAIYKKILQDIMMEIMDDPVLRSKWLEFVDSGEEDVDLTYAPLLAKFAGLEQYLTGPDYHPFIKDFSPTKDDLVSPKVQKVDELIQQSLDQGGKVIVAVHYKHSAKHLMEHSKFKNVALYYDASKRENVGAFQKDPNVKVMFAVMQSLGLGLNLQMANRIIIADIDWTPGNTKQLIARAWRPTGPEIAKGKRVYVDYVMANNSADVIKVARLIAKRTFNAQIMEGSPVTPPKFPALDENSLMSPGTMLVSGDYLSAETKYNEWIQERIDTKRAELDYKPVVPNILPDLKGSKTVDFPWVVGMGSMPVDAKGKPFREWLADNNLDPKNLKGLKKALKGRFAVTEFGEGKIVGVYRRSVKIRFSDGSSATLGPSKVFLLDKAKTTTTEELKPKTKKVKAPKKVKLLKQVKVTLPKLSMELGLFNNYYTIMIDDEEVGATLPKFKFHDIFWSYPVKSKASTELVLKKLKKKFNIPRANLKQIEFVLDHLKRTKIDPKAKLKGNIKNFFQLIKKPANPGNLKIYPLVEGQKVSLVVDAKTHRGVQLTRYGFKKLPSGYYYVTNNKANFKARLKSLASDFVLQNQKTLQKALDDMGIGRIKLG